MEYTSLSDYLKEKYNTKVYKLSLSSGCSCPNRDGKISTGGCIFCSEGGSGDFASSYNTDIEQQIIQAKSRVDQKISNKIPESERKYIAYFQAHTNTYAPVHILKQKYEEALAIPNVIGIAIATRADSITNETMDYLEELNKRTNLTIELGLQTIHEKTSKLINRCHTLEQFEKTVKELQKRKIEIVVHIINGLPYETKEMMIETVKYLNKLKINGIKIHMLNITKNTKIYEQYQKEKFHLLTKEEYIDIVTTELQYLDPKIVIHRITSDPDKEELIEPKWLIKKFCLLNDIDKYMKKNNIYQGQKISEE